MSEPETTPFDNEDSLLYKWAHYYQQPVRYMLRIDGVFLPMIPYISDQLPQSVDQHVLLDIYHRVSSPSVYPLPNNRLETDVAIIVAKHVDNPEMVDVINDYYRSLGLEASITDYDDLQEAITRFDYYFNQYLQQDRVVLNKLLILQTELGQQQALSSSQVSITSVILLSTPKIMVYKNGERVPGPEPTPEQGLDIWNLTYLTHYVPFVRYNSRDTLSKVYLERLPDNLTTIIPANIYQTGTISATVRLIDQETTTARALSKAYTTIVYDLDSNTLSIPIPDTSDPEIYQRTIDRIGDSFPLALEQLRYGRIGGVFVVYDVAFNNAILLDMILTFPIFNSYVYVDESDGITKDKITILYRSFNQQRESVRASLSRGILSENQQLTLLDSDSNVALYDVNAGTPFVTVNIVHADNVDTANRFMEIFRRLLSYYVMYHADVTNTYQIFLGRSFEPATLEASKIPGVTTDVFVDGLSDQLALVAPHIFVKNYSRTCQSAHKPAIIQPDYITQYTSQTFIKSGKEYHRQVLPYPKDNPEIYIVCPSDTYPFPGVKASRLSNMDKYPYIPCCYEDDQTTKAGSDYNRFYRDNQLKAKSSTRHHKLLTNKVLEPGRIGSLSNSITTLLQRDISLNGLELSRYGVNIGPNSFLYCACIANNDPDYWNAKDKEQYIRQLRVKLAGFDPNLVKQELYDLTDDEIVARITDTDSFFDPSVFYRLVEEAFDINVYVFYPAPNKGTEPGGIELPRHRLFHVQPLRQRPCMLILKHRGGGSDALPQPQCELIVASIDKEYQMLYGPQMSRILFEATNAMNQVYTWFPNPISAHTNFYNLVDYTVMFPNPTAQYIDSYGKLRALISDGITVYFPPSQPVNLPTMEGPTRVKASIIIDKYGPPSAVDRDRGLWYPLGDVANALYFPIEPGSLQLNGIKQGPLDPLFAPRRIGKIDRVRLLKRVLRILLQYILWTFALMSEQSNSSPSRSTPNQSTSSPSSRSTPSSVSSPTTLVSDYLQQWITVGNGEQDDLQLYDLTNVKRILPVVSTVQQAIDYINDTIPGMIRNNRIYVPDSKVAQGVEYYLNSYLANTRPEQRKPIKTIDGLYEETIDFIQQPNTAIFLKQSDLDKWMNSVSLERARVTDIRDKLQVEYADSRQPYLYKTPDNDVYLVQNTSRGSVTQALQIAVDWSLHGINDGYEAIDYNEEIDHVMYTISTTGGLAIVKQPHSRDNLLQILRYPDGRHAALLPLGILA